MPDLDKYFKDDNTASASHPLIRLLHAHKENPDFNSAKVEIIRKRAALGFEPAQLSLLFFNKQDKVFDYKTEPWDADLNHALVEFENPGDR